MRIASLQPSVTVTLRDLGCLDLLVACTRYCADVCPELAGRDVRIIQDSWTAKAEEVAAAKPDIVVASVPYQLKAVAEIIRSGIRFLGLAPKCLDDIYGDIRAIANLAGVPGHGDTTVRSMQAAIAEVRKIVNGLERPRVFCEEWGKPVIRSQRWVAELVDAAGGEFLGKPGTQTDTDSVRQQAPEVILAAWCGAGDRVPLEKIIRERSWPNTPAAVSGRVFCVADELLNTPASTLIGGLRAIAWALHPERFDRPGGIRAIQSV